MMYPGTKTLMCDPAWSAGYTDYVQIKPTTATPVCYLSDTFGRPNNTNPDDPDADMDSLEITDMSLVPIVTENKYGEGNVIFMANSEYPGAPEVFPLYKMMVKQILSASHRVADLKVIGSDKLRFAMFEGEDTYKLYIFNSDFNSKNFAKVIFKGEEKEVLIDSCALEIIEYKK